MSLHDSPIFDQAQPAAVTAGELDIAMQVVMQDGASQRQPLRDRLKACLPTLSAHAVEMLLKQCRAAAQQGISLAVRVQSRILTRREAGLALYDQFPGLTRSTSERVIAESIRRLGTMHFSLSSSPAGT